MVELGFGGAQRQKSAGLKVKKYNNNKMRETNHQCGSRMKFGTWTADSQ